MACCSVQEATVVDIPSIVDYFHTCPEEQLVKMGIDKSKLLPDFKEVLSDQLELPSELKQLYCLVWVIDGEIIGHSNINKIVYGKEAYIHMHIWHPQHRRSGLAHQLVRQSMSVYFEKFHLLRLLCEPNARNEAPNRTLARAGFTKVDSYTCVPGWINFEQEVNLWQITREEAGV